MLMIVSRGDASESTSTAVPLSHRLNCQLHSRFVQVSGGNQQFFGYHLSALTLQGKETEVLPRCTLLRIVWAIEGMASAMAG
jgi:hypothetical protein